MARAWDFTIDYDFMASFNARFGRGGPVSADGQAPDPTGVCSFAGAIEKQVGLKLQVRKSPQPVLVIDHWKKTPATTES